LLQVDPRTLEFPAARSVAARVAETREAVRAYNDLADGTGRGPVPFGLPTPGAAHQPGDALAARESSPDPATRKVTLVPFIPVLFGNDSYALGPATISVREELLPKLREPGVTAVINGFASTPGTAEAKYILSFQRATVVARFLEANGIPEPSLIIVGHGATDVVGSGTSGANRRVLVVIEKPSGGSRAAFAIGPRGRL